MAQTRETPVDLEPAELAAWRGMLRAHASLFRDMDAELTAAHGLALRSYEVLLHLEDAPRHRLRMSDLCHRVLLSASGVSRLVDRLERDDLVRRERCSEDGRGYWAVLTSRGETAFREARATHLAGVRSLFLRHFTASDLGRLADYWERVAPGVTKPAAPTADDGDCA
jgi:DNA-binding MarR family transcriptional regulator